MDGLPGQASIAHVDITLDVNECSAGSPCPENTMCINSPGSFVCTCRGQIIEVNDVCEGEDVKAASISVTESEAVLREV